MATEPQAAGDDDALSWDGDESLTAPPKLQRGWTAVGKGSEAVEVVGDESDAAVATPVAATGVSNAALIGLGVIGGIFVLYTVGWIIGGMRLQPDGELLAAGTIQYAIAAWVAAAAPAIWFATVMYLTRASKTWIRFAGLIAGVVLLVPWPFVVGGIGA
ncbi:hypothetical protein GCM10009860_04380 [Microbacterium mitrae]|uniref:DNA polymerase III subunit gamma/tau n=1 Tax=Microbacterium mitrae TaxID=664640 RepID=A0A5C8HP25_9MICO|nr:hypothetical protein [Microbacterium mitrae]TXK05836.1 hypothetical protein FVP60_02295 [Microbacterium mitrae]